MERHRNTIHQQLMDTAAAQRAERARIANARAQLAIARAKLAERRSLSQRLAEVRPALVAALACLDIVLIAWAVARVAA